jgi:hypothetical protein
MMMMMMMMMMKLRGDGRASTDNKQLESFSDIAG